MKAIKFSQSELEFLQNHYELELLDAENYVGEIKNILKKLGVFEKEIAKEKPVKTTDKKRGRPKKQKKEKKVVVETPVQKSAPAKVVKNPVVKAAPKTTKSKSGQKNVKKTIKPAAPKNVKPVAATPVVKTESIKSI